MTLFRYRRAGTRSTRGRGCSRTSIAHPWWIFSPPGKRRERKRRVSALHSVRRVPERTSNETGLPCLFIAAHCLAKRCVNAGSTDNEQSKARLAEMLHESGGGLRRHSTVAASGNKNCSLRHAEDQRVFDRDVGGNLKSDHTILRVVMFFTKRRGYRTIAGVSILFAEKTDKGPLDRGLDRFLC